MTKKILLFNAVALATFTLSAQNTETQNTTNNLAIIITLIVALLALIITVINSFRISHLKKVSEVEYNNLKDDLNLTAGSLKSSLSKEIRGLKRDAGRNSKPRNTNNRKPKTEETSKETEGQTDSETNKTAKKPYKKRNTNYRRRPAKKQEGSEKETVKAEEIKE